ncbi:hypothetical protein LINGRAHAP2_LOCUS7036 [Linum grandiflorum]
MIRKTSSYQGIKLLLVMKIELLVNTYSCVLDFVRALGCWVLLQQFG